ncbi:hybrid sensor histidine kinase/response regulator [Burkholderia singularis]|uniref:histidine kinase n=1 Tax=Burkholderia singularis TaxID=1503053 RepID=A0A124P9S3_9BURK|nr:ATP-binding protein [Burkholderia singularis]KVE29378.1 hybrid sensor histidine kinase/response regulator [Burkholderia singularis]
MGEANRTRAGDYVIAVMMVAIATVLQALAIRFGGVNLPLILYYPLLAGAAWATSFGFGTAATVASALLVWTLFLSDPSAYTEPLSIRVIRLGAFVIIGVLVCAGASMLRHARLTNERARRREAAARARLEAVLHALPHGVIAIDAQRRITHLNAAAADLVGCPLDGTIGRPVHDVLRLCDSDGRSVRTAPLDRALGGAAATCRHWLHSPGRGGLVPVAGIASPIGGARGDIDGAVLLLRDEQTQSDRRDAHRGHGELGEHGERGERSAHDEREGREGREGRQEHKEHEEHEEHEERARVDASRLPHALVDASPDAIVGIDREGRIVSWNPAAQRMFGYDEREAIGRELDSLIAMRWLKREPAVKTFDGVRGPLDLLCVNRDGRRFRVTASAGLVRGDAFARVALSLTLRETGEQRRRDLRARRSLQGARDARDQAHTSNRLKDELLATVSHELRTPLNVIYGWVEVLRNSGDKTLQQQAIDAIDRSARSLTRMVGDILDASSLSTGKLRLDLMPVDIVRLFSDTVDAFQTAAAAAGIALRFDCTVVACVVSGDAERLRQMLSNLVSNALKFTPGGGTVTVALARDDAHAVLRVSDTGQGIAPEFMPYVFDMFRRADDSPASSRRGLGLGLSIVRHIAQLHCGSVAVDSEGRNRGATFTVTLPASPSFAGAMAWSAAPADGGRDPLALHAQRVLIVDDDATTRASLTAALTTFGATVAIAASGREALKVAADMQPSVVLSDLAMPDGDGFWLLDALRRGAKGNSGESHEGRDVRVLAVTAHAGLADERRVREAGFDGYLRKPIDVRQLAREIERVTKRDG